MIYTVPLKSIQFDIRDNYPSDEIVIREIWQENVYEVRGEHLKGNTIIDIGANIGAFSIYAASHNSKVYAIEPEPNNLQALKRNIELNNMGNRIIVCPYGISNFKGTAIINDDGGGSTIKDSHTGGAEIEIMTLDNFFDLHQIKNVDIMKIDVEGAEPEIILGASKETLQECKYIAMEFDIRSGHMIGEIVKKLSETHHVRTMGSWERGGMIWAWIY